MNQCTSALSDIQGSDPARAAEIEAGLKYWLAGDGSWRKRVDNLCNDPHLPMTARQDLMKVFDGSLSDKTELLEAYKIKCLDHLLKGPEYCDLPADRTLWNSVSEKTFKERLRKTFKKKYLWVLRNLQANVKKFNSSRKSKNAGISPYNMWGTWSETAGGYPFEPWFRADHIRSRLGLSELDRHQPLCVIGYRLPDDINAYVPTVADARDSSYFKPNNLGAPGYTDPWHPKKKLLDDKKRAFYPEPCPEVVHAPVTTRQIKEVRCLPK